MRSLIISFVSLVQLTIAQQCACLYATAQNNKTISYTGVTDLTTPVTSIAFYTDGTYIYRF